MNNVFSRDLVGKLLALIAGVLVLALLLEGALRVSGWGHSPAEGDASLDAPGLTVLCLGDSFTYGLGAPPDQSYPRQLERGLRADLGEDGASVVNRGVLSASSWRVLEEAQDALASGQPDLMVVLAGGANSSELWGAGDPQDGVSGVFEAWAWKVRLVRLGVFLARALELAELEGLEPEADVGPGFQNVVRMLGQPSSGPGAPMGRPCTPEATVAEQEGWTLLNRGQPDAALEPLQRALSLEPQCPAARRGLVVVAAMLGDEAALIQRLRISLDAGHFEPMLYTAGSGYFRETGQTQRELDWHARYEDRLPPGFQDGPGLARLYMLAGRVDESRQQYEALSQQPGTACDGHWGLVELAQAASDEPLRDRQLARFLEQPARDCQAIRRVVSLLCGLGQADEALRWVEVGVAADPPSLASLLNAASTCLEPEYLPPLQRSLVAGGLPEDQVRGMIDTISSQLGRSAEGRDLMERDLQLLADLAQERSVPLMLVTYPHVDPLNRVIRDVAAQRGLAIADTEAVFEALWAQGEARHEYFTGDSEDPILRDDHPAARGYGIIARTIQQTMAQQGLLPPVTP